MTQPTRQEIARDWEFWQEYVDPEGIMTRVVFDAMTTGERVKLQVDLFGPEPDEDA